MCEHGWQERRQPQDYGRRRARAPNPAAAGPAVVPRVNVCSRAGQCAVRNAANEGAVGDVDSGKCARAGDGSAGIIELVPACKARLRQR